MTTRFVLSLLFALLVTIFAIQNAVTVTINFLFAEFDISQALVILISAVLGAGIVLLLGTIKQIKSNLKLRNLSKTVAKLEEENKVLKGENESLKKNIEKLPQEDKESN